MLPRNDEDATYSRYYWLLRKSLIVMPGYNEQKGMGKLAHELLLVKLSTGPVQRQLFS